MGLLKPKKTRKRKFRERGALRCPPAGHQVTWCRGLCEPRDGQGLCGRVAPHALKGRTQLAIESCNRRESGEE